jgi:translation initiation factor IF-3
MNKSFQNRPRRAPPKVENRPKMNDEITFNELRVVTPSPNGKDVALGVMNKREALEKAKELGNLDLILINGNSDPPVCKIVDYSKHRYMQEKKAKEVKKNSKTSELKEVKMSYQIDVHDYDVRKKSALKFIKQGNRVKCTVTFRGREIQHDRIGIELLEKLAKDLDETCSKESAPIREGKSISLILSPRAEIMKAINVERRARDKAKKRRKELAEQRGERVVDEDDDDDEEEYDEDDDDEEDYYDEEDEEAEPSEVVAKVEKPAVVASTTTTAAATPSTKAKKTLEKLLDDYY